MKVKVKKTEELMNKLFRRENSLFIANYTFVLNNDSVVMDWKEFDRLSLLIDIKEVEILRKTPKKGILIRKDEKYVSIEHAVDEIEEALCLD